MKPSFLLFFLALLSFFVPVSLLQAQQDVIVVNRGSLVRIGLAPLTGPAGQEITSIVGNDLKRTSEMTPVGSGSGDYNASGSYAGTSLTGTLIKRSTGQPVVSQSFTGDYRSAAHQFADAITQAVTGHPGFATSRLAYIGQQGGSKELFIADIDGFNARAITHDHVICASPALSHEGKELAYTSYKSGYADVYLINLLSGSRTRIAYYPGINSGPNFSPEGNRIALTLSKDGNPEIYTLGTDGSNPVRITRTRGGETSPSWSPDGARLVYSSDDHGSPQLVISDANGVSGVDHLVTGNSFCTKPDWSPDGNLIAFTTRLGGVFQIGVYTVATRTAKVVTSGGGQDPVWTRDSRHLVYSNQGRLSVLDTVSGNSAPIEVNTMGAGEPSLSR